DGMISPIYDVDNFDDPITLDESFGSTVTRQGIPHEVSQACKQLSADQCDNKISRAIIKANKTWYRSHIRFDESSKLAKRKSSRLAKRIASLEMGLPNELSGAFEQLRQAVRDGAFDRSTIKAKKDW